MQEIYELLQIVTPTKVRKITFLGNENKTSRLRQLYDLLHQSPQLTEEEIQRELYGNTTTSQSAFSKLKNRLQDQLLRALFLIDLKQPAYTNRQQAYYELLQKWAAAKMLFGKRSYQTAVRLSKQILRQAQRYEFTELCVDVCHQLRRYFATVGNKKGDFKKYAALLNKFSTTWQAETELEGHYLEIVSLQNAGITRALLAERISGAQNWLAQQSPPWVYYQYQLCAALIELAGQTTQFNYIAGVSTCQHAIDLFAAKPYHARVPLEVFTYQYLVCCYHLEQYSVIGARITPALTSVREGTFNWFQYQQVRVLTLFRTENYDAAWEAWLQTTSHSAFTSLQPLAREQWLLLEGYFVILQQTNALTIDAPDFSTDQFFKQFDTLKKYKSGLNTPLVVLDLLLPLFFGQKDHILDRAEAVDKYARRHLRVTELERSFLFLRQLLRLANVAFNTEVFVGSDKDVTTRFAKLPTKNESYGVEIILYPTLWRYLLSIL